MTVDSLIAQNDQLTRLNFANVLGIQEIERAGFRCHDPTSTHTPQAQRTEAMRIAHRNQPVIRHQDQRERAAHLTQRIDDAREKRTGTGMGDQMDDDFAVGGGLKDRAVGFELVAQDLSS